MGSRNPACSSSSAEATPDQAIGPDRKVAHILCGEPQRQLGLPLGDTAAIDLRDTHVASDGGVHIAALGGVRMIAVLGFAGLKLLPDGIALDPQLPAGWTALAFKCQWRSRSLHIHIDQGANKVAATLTGGKPMTLVVQGKQLDVRVDKPLRPHLGPWVKPAS